MKVGDKIWRMNQNRRRYSASNRGAPIYREHWEQLTISGETSRSWIVGEHKWSQHKVPKKGEHHGWAFSEQEVVDDVWANANRYPIVRAVERLEGAMLRKVATLIGHKDISEEPAPRRARRESRWR